MPNLLLRMEFWLACCMSPIENSDQKTDTQREAHVQSACSQSKAGRCLVGRSTSWLATPRLSLVLWQWLQLFSAHQSSAMVVRSAHTAGVPAPLPNGQISSRIALCPTYAAPQLRPDDTCGAAPARSKTKEKLRRISQFVSRCLCDTSPISLYSQVLSARPPARR